ncbi:solute carrier family 2, facilitated glucose transporter member 12 [Rhinatrema bivittatum]|uniref:solute carrier family 2, facilitated glucose transporter member 12 n=1 Tax=Rhinatrema bivittatum TaxID=194408 RepID=UPI0011265BDF|nr:solute carrier family 2, facilitated glucose transporter member 12 [Rhinatrema bivittatum]
MHFRNMSRPPRRGIGRQRGLQPASHRKGAQQTGPHPLPCHSPPAAAAAAADRFRGEETKKCPEEAIGRALRQSRGTAARPPSSQSNFQTMAPEQSAEELQLRGARLGEGEKGTGSGSPQQPPAQTGCGTFTLLSSVIASVSGLLVGYELGIISGALLQLHSLLELTCSQQELVVSSLLTGALLASLTGGFLIDHYGRKTTIIISSCLLVLANLLLISVITYEVLIIGRAIIGVAISLSAIATCVYIAEIAPQHKRGLLVSLNELMFVVGILLAYVSNYVFAAISHGWKYMFGLIIPLATLQGIAMYFLPKSPRFLLKKGHDAKARRVLQRLRPATDTTEELAAVKDSLKAEHQYSFLDLFRSKDNMRARMLIGLTLVFFVQVTGQPNIVFYASTVLKSVGFDSNEAASLASTGVGVVKVIGTIPAIFFVDKVGSKPFLCIGSAVMAVSLITMGVVSLKIDINFSSICRSHAQPNQSREGALFHDARNLTSSDSLKAELVGITAPNSFLHITPENLETTKTEGWNWRTAVVRTSAIKQTEHPESVKKDTPVPAVLKWTCLASLLAFVAAFSIGLGPMAWLVLSEIFPVGIKGRAFAFTCNMNWGMNLLISLTFLTLTESVGLPWIFFSYSIMSFASLAFVIMFVPETKGRSLEQISVELSEKQYMKKNICCRNQNKKKPIPVEALQTKSEEAFS